MSTNLETIRQWIRVAFRKRRRGRRRELPQDLPNGSRLSELTNSWRDQASRDEWSRVSCAKVMRAPFVILHDAPIGAALELLERNGLCALLVVDGNQDLQGLVTREDLMAGCDDRPEADIDPRCVGDVMLEVDPVRRIDLQLSLMRCGTSR